VCCTVKPYVLCCVLCLMNKNKDGRGSAARSYRTAVQ
jgi:hypothetical protein